MTRRARRPLGLVLTLALLVGALAGVSGSSAQAPPTPPTPPAPAPEPPVTPVTPGEPDGPPVGQQDPESPPPQAGPSRLRPFPVVLVAGRQGPRSTVVTQLSVRGPRGARVAVRCVGRKCSMQRAVTTIGPAKRLRVRRAERVFRAGLAIEVRVTGKDRVGKYTKVRFRRSRTPARSDACLQPGTSKPGPCA